MTLRDSTVNQLPTGLNEMCPDIPSWLLMTLTVTVESSPIAGRPFRSSVP